MPKPKKLGAPPRPVLTNHDGGVLEILERQGLTQTPKTRRKAENTLAQVRLAAMAEAIEVDAAEIVQDVLNYAKADNEEELPPHEMVERYGERVANERWRRMKHGMLSAKDAPMGIRLAMNIYTTSMRIKSEKERPKLNAQVVMLNVAPQEQYEVIQVEK